MYALLDMLRVLISIDFMCQFLEPVSLESKLKICLSDVYTQIQLNTVTVNFKLTRIERARALSVQKREEVTNTY